MVNRGGVGAAFARGRAPIILVLLFLGGAVLLGHDLGGLQHPSKSSSANPRDLRAAFARLPMSFEPNQGQADNRVKFLARGNGYVVYFTPSETVLALPQHAQPGLRQVAVQMRLAGANQNSPISALHQLPGHSNYLIGQDPSGWHRNIPQFARVQYHDVYPGIDLAYYGNQGRLEYDFDVSPGADPRRVELSFNGANNLHIAANGDLVVALAEGELRFEAPHVYQNSSAGIENVMGAFVLRGKNSAGFEIGDYDRSRTLVIDPVLAFSTYLGGSGDESCTAIIGATAGFVPHCPAMVVDSASRIYVAGATTSTGTFAGGTPFVIPPTGTATASEFVFVARFDVTSTRSALEYVTYIGGSSTQYPVGLAVDGGFNAYIAGTTNSSDFPTTAGAIQAKASAPGNHVFVSKLDSIGQFNLYSTYLSGTGVDTASGLAVDSLGRAYVFGTTTTPSLPTSSGFPITPGALQPSAGAVNQFFFTKINPALNGPSSLLYSTYIGGTTPSTGVVTGGAVAVDNNFNVYLAGGTDFTDMVSGTWIVNAFHSSSGGGLDAWVAKLQPATGNTQQYTPVYGTYFGGGGNDVAYGVATDGTSTYVTGSTNSTGLATATGTAAFQTCLDQPPPNPTTCASGLTASDAFVAKFGVPTTTGTTQGTVPLDYFTYLGGSSNDAGLAIVTDSVGDARVTGFTDSSDFPVVPTTACSSSVTSGCNPLQVTNGGGRDAFLARIVTTTTSTTTNTSTSGFLGGTGTDIGTDVTLDANLNTYLSGETASSNFFTTANALEPSTTGLPDAFASEVGPTISLCFSPVTPCPAVSTPTVTPTPTNVGSQITFKYLVYNTGDPVTGAVFTDTLGTNSTFVSASASPGTCGTATNGLVTCNLGTLNTSATNSSTSVVSPVDTITIVVSATSQVLQGPLSVGNSATLTVPGTTFPTQSATGNATVNDFTVSASPATATVIAGAPASYAATVKPTGGGFPASVSLACGSGLPSGGACQFTNNPIPNMNNGAQSRTFEITTTARVTTPGSLFLPGGPTYALWLPIFGAGLIGAGISRKRRILLGTFFSLALGIALLQAGCGSSRSTTTTTGTPAGTYTVTVNATAGATRSTTVQITVQ